MHFRGAPAPRECKNNPQKNFADFLLHNGTF